jgi:hypothetical protein
MNDDRTDKADVLQGTLILLVLRTLEALGPLHGYGIALSGSVAHGAGRMDLLQVGGLGEEP